MPSEIENPVKRELSLTRYIGAPRGNVFKAWTHPWHMAKWWGLKGFTNPVCELEDRPGGAFRIVMQSPGGIDYPVVGVFREIIRPELLVFTASALPDTKGRPGIEIVHAVVFVEKGDMTKLTLTARLVRSRFEADETLAGMEKGWMESLERLENIAVKI